MQVSRSRSRAPRVGWFEPEIGRDELMFATLESPGYSQSVAAGSAKAPGATPRPTITRSFDLRSLAIYPANATPALVIQGYFKLDAPTQVAESTPDLVTARSPPAGSQSLIDGHPRPAREPKEILAAMGVIAASNMKLAKAEAKSQSL